MDFKDFVNESNFDATLKRKVSHQDRNNVLKQYDSPDTFVSFTTVPKLGINPKSPYNTPIGIYAYPIRYVINSYDDGHAFYNVPFASNCPYMIVFKINDPSKTLVFQRGNDNPGMGHELPGSEWKSRKSPTQFPFEDRVESLFRKENPTPQVYRGFKSQVTRQRIACGTAYAWLATRRIAQENPRKWTSLLIRLGFNGCVDYGTGTIHENEPTQAVFFKTQDLTLLNILDNKKRTRINGDLNAFNPHEQRKDLAILARQSMEVAVFQAPYSLQGLGNYLSKAYRCYSYMKVHDPQTFNDDYDDIQTSLRTIWASVMDHKDKDLYPDVVKYLSKTIRAFQNPAP